MMVKKNIFSIIHVTLLLSGIILLWRQDLPMWDLIGILIFLTALTVASYTDFKEQMVPLPSLLVMTAGACLSKFNEPVFETGFCILIALACGLILYGLGRLTSGGISTGDILLLMNFALLYNWEIFISLTLYATLSAALLGLVMMLFKKWSKTTQLPFAPILAIVFLFNIAINS